MRFVRVSEEFELSQFELPGVNYYKMYYQIQGKLDVVRVSGEFELSEFELAGFYCMVYDVQPNPEAYTVRNSVCLGQEY